MLFFTYAAAPDVDTYCPTRPRHAAIPTLKLCRFGNAGDENHGATDADGRIRVLSGVIADLGPAELAPERLRALAAIDLATLPLVAATERMGPPIIGRGQLLANGHN